MRPTQYMCFLLGLTHAPTYSDNHPICMPSNYLNGALSGEIFQTESQLSQFIKELQMAVFVNKMNVMNLGSRKTFALMKLHLESPHTEMGNAWNSRGFAKQRSPLAAQCLDNIEYDKNLGMRTLGTCPYYGSRNMVRIADLLVLPYQSLLFKSSREELGLNLKYNIIKIDEAHNFTDSLTNMYDSKITLSHTVHSILEWYLDDFWCYLEPNPQNHIQTLKNLTQAFLQVLCDKEDGNLVDSCCDFTVDVYDFVFAQNIDGINLVKLLKHIKESNIRHMTHELGLLLYTLASVIPEGIVVFFPSFDYESGVCEYWESSSILQKIIKRKCVFREPRNSMDVESVLKEYKDTIDALSGMNSEVNQASHSGAILLAEGINLSDGMG
ncbi:ATP-dependent RNA helicase DDX11 [Spatholobus suberectus]|nr:ATP-dependent RNA helicase DDX11 [Spatholobus suberectus]